MIQKFCVMKSYIWSIFYRQKYFIMQKKEALIRQQYKTDSDIDNILINEKSHKNNLIYDISCSTLIGAKPLHFWFDKVDKLIKICDGTRYFILLGSENYDVF